MTICTQKNNTEYWNNLNLKPIVDSSLALWFTSDFDTDNITWLDRSGNNNNCTLYGGATRNRLYPTEIFGSSYAFDGTNDYGMIVHNPSLTTTGDFTIETTVYPRRWNANWAFISKKYGTASQWKLTMGALANQWGFAWYNGTVWRNSYGGSLPLNQWAHLTCVIDKTNNVIKNYKNGILSHQNTFASVDISAITENIYLSYIGSSTYYAQSNIDQVRIYNKVLTDTEVYNNYITTPLYYAQTSI